jgi:hypothetical protein
VDDAVALLMPEEVRRSFIIFFYEITALRIHGSRFINWTYAKKAYLYTVI